MIALDARFFPQRLRTRIRTTAVLLAVTLSGLLTACGGGDGGGGGASTTPPPTTPTLSSIAVTPATPSATLGVAPATVSLTATGTYSDGSTKVLTTTASWTSSATTVATVGAATGVVTPVAAGTTKITATYEGVTSAPITFTVNPATLKSIAVTGTLSATLGVAPTTVPLTATGTYSDGTTKVLSTTAAWTSSATTVATVGAATGVVTPVAAGSTNITATYEGVTSPAVTFTVNPAALTSIAVTPTSSSIAKGLTQAFSAIGTYSDGSHQTITTSVLWASATPTVATISNTAGSNGIATGKGVGTSAITASLAGVTSPATGAGSATLTVTPATLVSVAINPTGPTIAVGKTQQFSVVGNYTDGTIETLTSTSVTWISSNTSTATISNASGTAGLATTVALGTTMISISGNTYNGQTVAPVTLTVSATVYAYATNFGEGTVSEYEINPAGSTNPGALTPLPTPTIAAGTKPFSVSVEPTGQYAYVANYGSANVSEYTIGAGGQLTAVGTGTVATGNYPNGVTIDPTDTHAYVANLKDSTVSQFSIGTDGVLNPLSPATVTTLSSSTGVPNPSAIAIDPSGRFAFVANFGDDTPVPPAGASTITQYTVSQTDGTLTLNGTPTAVSGSGPNAFVFASIAGVEYAYVVNVGDGTVSQYSISSTGVLTPLSPATVTSGTGASTTKPFGLAVNPAGTYLYVANAGENTISAFSISQTTGALMSIGNAVTSGAGVSSVTVDATGKYLYGTNRGTNTISQFSISQTNGTLTLLTTAVASGSTTASQPTSIATGY